MESNKQLEKRVKELESELKALIEQVEALKQAPQPVDVTDIAEMVSLLDSIIGAIKLNGRVLDKDSKPLNLDGDILVKASALNALLVKHQSTIVGDIKAIDKAVRITLKERLKVLYGEVLIDEEKATALQERLGTKLVMVKSALQTSPVLIVTFGLVCTYLDYLETASEIVKRHSATATIKSLNNDLPKELRGEDDEAFKVFARAIEQGLLKKKADGYRWDGSLSLSALAYMFGRLYCGDYWSNRDGVKLGDGKVKESKLRRVFGLNRFAHLRNQIDITGVKPKGSDKLDRLFN